MCHFCFNNKLVVIGLLVFSSIINAQGEGEFVWQVISPFTGQVWDVQSKAEGELKGYSGDPPVWGLLNKREILDQSLASASYRYTANPLPYEMGEWNHFLSNAIGGTVTATSESEMLDIMAERFGNQRCGPGEVSISSGWTPNPGIPPDFSAVEWAEVTANYNTNEECNNNLVSIQRATRSRERNCAEHYIGVRDPWECVLPYSGSVKGFAPYCSASRGNPCNISTGEKNETQNDYQGMELQFTRTYHSSANTNESRIGNSWYHNYGRRIIFRPISAFTIVPKGILDSAGHQETLEQITGGWRTSDGRKLVYKSGDEWVLEKQGAIKEYYTLIRNGSAGLNFGLLNRIVDASGRAVTFTYDSRERLETVTDSYDRSLTFTYGGNGQVATMEDPAGNRYTYLYDVVGNLEFVVYPDETLQTAADNPRIQYHYEDPNFPSHLTGITNENGQRYATYAYDDSGRTVLSEHIGSGQRMTFEYNPDNTTTVRETINDTTESVQTYSFQVINGQRKITGITGDRCANCGQQDKNTTYDENGNLDQVTDWNNNITDYDFNDQGLEIQRIEAVGTPQQRTITTEWHSNLRLPIRRTEPGLIMEWVYDESSGTGNVLTEILIDTIGDCAIDNTQQHCRRITQYAYTEAGLLDNTDGPRTDVTDNETFDYNALGERIRTTNALGHVTEVLNFDAHGQPKAIRNPNGDITILVYDARQRLKQRTEAAGTTDVATTTFEYDGVGNLIRITQPNGSYLHYTFDASNRLISIADNMDNQIRYTLDNAGNRVKEETYDPNDILVQTQSRVFNALNQLIKSIGADNQEIDHEYDDNGNQIRITNPKNHATNQGFDPLNRLIQIIDPENGLDKPTIYDYDSQNNLTSVTDPEGLTTTYRYNGFGDVIEQDSPDTGITTYQYDQAGNRIQQTDARGVTVNFVYDALNRLVSVDYVDDNEDIVYIYDQTDNGNLGIGLQTQIEDQSGIMRYRYDRRGNIVRVDYSIHADSNSNELASINADISLLYEYDAADQLMRITYPSGKQIHYARDSLGRVNSVTALGETGDTQVLASNIQYQPFGPRRHLQYGNNLIETRQYDLDGRISNITVPGIFERQYGYDLNSNIATANNALDNSLNQSFIYDPLDRLDQADNAGHYGMLDYHYDGIGNRLSKSTNGAIDHYAYKAQSHHLDSISGTQSESFSYDEVGNTVLIGDKTFDYNQANRLASATVESNTTEYIYNALGQRIIKAGPAVDDRVFLYDVDGQLLAEIDSLGNIVTEYVYLNNQRLALAHFTPGNSDFEQAHNLAGDNGQLSTNTRTAGQQVNEPNHANADGTHSVWFSYTVTADGELRLDTLGSDFDTVLAVYMGDTLVNLSELAADNNGGENNTSIVTLPVEAGQTLMIAVDGVDGASGALQLNWQLNTAVVIPLPAWALVLLAGGIVLVAIRYNNTTRNIVQYGLLIALPLTIIHQSGAQNSETPIAQVTNWYFMHTDHLDTPQKMTDMSGTVVWQAQYTPFGQATVDEDPDGDGSAVENPLRFPGQYFDEEIELHYNYFRYYNPGTGRYVTSDYIGLAGGLNTYIYTLDNPVNLYDSNGASAISSAVSRIILKCVTGIAVGSGIESTTQLGICCFKQCGFQLWRCEPSKCGLNMCNIAVSAVASCVASTAVPNVPPIPVTWSLLKPALLKVGLNGLLKSLGKWGCK